MRDTLCVALLLAASIAAAGQQPSIRADANPGAEGEVKALELKLAQLIVRGEWEEYGQHLASDYLHTGYNGEVEGKDEALASLQDEHRKVVVLEMEPADQRVRVYGDTGISNAEFTVSVRESGKLKTRRIRLTDVFVRRDGQWYLVAEQETAFGK
jgi:ketosteroid isomerase-like protein